MANDKSIPKLNNPLRNRIVGQELVAVDQLLANPFNFRLHSEAQQHALAGSMDEIGFIHALLVNKTTGHIIDGHARVKILLRSDVEEITVDYVELTDDEEKKALMLLDPIAAMAGTDADMMDEVLQSINSDDERVQQALADITEEAGIIIGDIEFKEYDEDIIDSVEYTNVLTVVINGRNKQIFADIR